MFKSLTNLLPLNKTPSNRISLALLLGAGSFAVFHFATQRQVLKPKLIDLGLNENNATIYAEVGRKLIGGVVLGATGLWIRHQLLPKTHSGQVITPSVTKTNLVKTLAISVAVGWLFHRVVKQQMQNPVMWQFYPEVKTQQFTRPVAIASGIAWLTYLAGFEYFFREALVHGIAEYQDKQAALAYSTALYVLVHLPTNWRETLACLPMGYVFGGLSLATGSFVSPYLVHSLIAITSDLAAAKANPSIEFG